VPGEWYIERLLSFEEVGEATSWAMLQQEVQLIYLAERLVELNDGWMVQVHEHLSFNDNLFQTIFTQENVNKHLFKRIKLQLL
jgi:hypothetical protein